MQVNTVKCTVCKRWIHKRYTGVRGNLPLVVDGFRCNRCDGKSLETTSMFMTTAIQTLDENQHPLRNFKLVQYLF